MHYTITFTMAIVINEGEKVAAFGALREVHAAQRLRGHGRAEVGAGPVGPLEPVRERRLRPDVQGPHEPACE